MTVSAASSSYHKASAMAIEQLKKSHPWEHEILLGEAAKLMLAKGVKSNQTTRKTYQNLADETLRKRYSLEHAQLRDKILTALRDESGWVDGRIARGTTYKVPCSKCGAQSGVRCVARNGKRTDHAHVSRVRDGKA